jgi:hypothetical protein
MKVKWHNLAVGDFFAYKNFSEEKDVFNLYQKITPKHESYNAVHLNTGRLCNIYEDNSLALSLFEKVDVEFAIKNV